MAAKTLRSVKLGEAAAPNPPPTDVKGAAEHSERALLVALRTRIATDIDNGVPPHTLAPLSRQLREIDREIRLLDARLKQEADDDASEGEDGTFDASAV